ncbi:ankyrin repeat and SOCS box protein 2-like [Centropristis striata]|uniref:ankyrin repeat and SOCS box protein 2-like n=1 Tax=Centropristis striata TaxID=184440 RepID=UPI0027DF6ADA|nr:ankyrin repeat and SOCS box protein 2-like [Centropristis striata]
MAANLDDYSSSSSPSYSSSYFSSPSSSSSSSSYSSSYFSYPSSSSSSSSYSSSYFSYPSSSSSSSSYSSSYFSYPSSSSYSSSYFSSPSSSSSSSSSWMNTRANRDPRPRSPAAPTLLDSKRSSAHQRDVLNSVNPPTGRFLFLYTGLQSEFTYVQSLIIDGNEEVLKEMVRWKPSSLTKPNDEGWIALHEAAYYGQPRCISLLLTVNKCTLKNQTALLLAASQGHVSCVDLLLKRGGDPNIANKEKETPLFAACEQPNEAVVKLLLRAGAKVNLCSVQGVSPLHEACRHGQLDICRTLLKAGADHHAKNIYGIRPLFIAAQHGHTAVLQLLASRGADVNGQAGDGASPLLEACKNGHVEAVKTLLSLKADANLSMKSGLLPLHAAVQNNHSRIVEILIPITNRVSVQNSGISPLHIAAKTNNDDILELLIASGFDVNTKLSEDQSLMYEDRRSTALYFSVYNGNMEGAEMLLEAGADPNLDVFNPLLIAVRLCNMDMAALLLEHGADVNAQIFTRPSSFPAAILLRMESLPMLKLLLDNGCHAASCFTCPYGPQPHPPVTPSKSRIDEMKVSREAPPRPRLQFCEVVSSPTFCRVAGPIVSLLLDYVGHVALCWRLLEVLDSRSDWAPIKLKAAPPRPLMQLCRLKIRRLLGVQRLKLLHTLPLPVRLTCYLQYDVTCSLT